MFNVVDEVIFGKSLDNCLPISLLLNFSLFEFVQQNHVSHYGIHFPQQEGILAMHHNLQHLHKSTYPHLLSWVKPQPFYQYILFQFDYLHGLQRRHLSL